MLYSYKLKNQNSETLEYEMQNKIRLSGQRKLLLSLGRDLFTT